MSRIRGESGQASVETVAIVPLVVLAAAVAWQLVLTGHTLWLAAGAARAAARAELVGENPARAARSAPRSGPGGAEPLQGAAHHRGPDGAFRVRGPERSGHLRRRTRLLLLTQVTADESARIAAM